MKQAFFSALFLLYSLGVLRAQAISINTDGSNAAPSAILDVKSTDKGVLVPRMTTAQRTAIAAPATGLLVFDTTTGGFWFYNGTAWTDLSTPRQLADADNDTKVQVEKSPDEDIIRFDLAGVEKMTLRQNAGNQARLEFGTSTNLAIGTNALLLNTNGNDNSAVGRNALDANTDGDYNTAAGSGALSSNTIGANNTAVGHQSMFYNSTASFNTAIGKMALLHATTGADNTAAGAYALSTNTTGALNTAIGYSADVSSANLTNTTAVGAHALAGASNSLILGSIAGVNGATNSVNVGIGTSIPNAKLDVAGAIKIGNTAAVTPAAGTIRWNDATEDFEGYTGTQWKSLTKGQTTGGAWGTLVTYENAQTQASDGYADDQFGFSVALSGDYAVIGAPYYVVNGAFRQGKAYIFVRSGASWSQQAILTASDGTAGGHFGYEVAISGNYAIIGGNYNKAYIFVRSGSTWSQQAILTASDGVSGDGFGWSVALSGDYAVVGARSHDTGGNSNQGKAYVFVRSGSNWFQQAILTASDGAAEDNFGNSVALSGDYAVVAAERYNTSRGKAYIFLRSGSTWSQQAILTASDGAAQDYFGCSVAISGNYAIIGAYNAGGNDQGKAYIFVRTGTAWSQQTILTASNASGLDRFGTNVAISGDYAIVGASSDKAYIFVRSGTVWYQEAILAASDDHADSPDLFGSGVAIFGDYAAAGAGGPNGGVNNYQGKVYFYSK